LLFALAAYVTVAAVWHLRNGTGEEFSWPGFVVALLAIPAMRYLAQRKIAIAEKIGKPRASRRRHGGSDVWMVVVCGCAEPSRAMAYWRVVG
jgi:divalent metal cation (Fe/Co/Zn/Cd) transporter